jgi:hypothetical protein
MTVPLSPEEFGVKIQTKWKQDLPTLPVPDDAQLQRWARIHHCQPQDLVRAIKSAETKLRYTPNAFHDPDHPISYVSSAANRYRNQREAQNSNSQKAA